MKILCPVFFTSVERMNQKRAGDRRLNYFRLEEGKNPVRKQGSSQPVKASSVRDQGSTLLGPWWGPLWPDSPEPSLRICSVRSLMRNHRIAKGVRRQRRAESEGRSHKRCRTGMPTPPWPVSVRSHFWERRCLQRPGGMSLQKAEVQDSVSDMQVEFARKQESVLRGRGRGAPLWGGSLESLGDWRKESAGRGWALQGPRALGVLSGVCRARQSCWLHVVSGSGAGRISQISADPCVWWCGEGPACPGGPGCGSVRTALTMGQGCPCLWPCLPLPWTRRLNPRASLTPHLTGFHSSDSPFLWHVIF